MVITTTLLSAVAIVFLIQVFLASKISFKEESLMPLESGFESLEASMFISAPFFFLAILFVLFDLELVLFFPGVLCSFSQVSPMVIWVLINFVVIFTLAIEWAFCGLKWQI